MNAGDKAIAILRADLARRKPEAPKFSPFGHPTKCEFQRHLDSLPFPAHPAPDLKPRLNTRGRRNPTKYGTWLHEHNYPEFCRQFAAYFKTQNPTSGG